MKLSYKMKIKSRNQPQWLCWMLIIMPFVFGTLTDLLGLPNLVKYSLDVAWVCALLMMLKMKIQDSGRRANALTAWAIFFFGYTLAAYVFNYQSPLYYLWGVRNNFRFYVAVAAFCTFLEPEDVDNYMKLFDKLFWFNVFVSLVQYFLLGIKRDYLGGIFGTASGCNGYSNIFFVIVLIKSVVFYMERRESLKDCILKFVAVILVAALAELKFFFLEAVLILALAGLFTKFSWRKLGIMLAGVIGIAAGAALLSAVFPEFQEFFSVEWFMDTATSKGGYTGSGDLNRLNFISVLDKNVLKTIPDRLFGLGLGNCDYAAYDFLTTPFFKKYSWSHYTWLSTSYIYLETGWVGMICFFGFFVLSFWKASTIEKTGTGIVRTYCRITKIMAIMCIAIAIYNASLRTEAGYMAYFVLAIPFIISKQSA